MSVIDGYYWADRHGVVHAIAKVITGVTYEVQKKIVVSWEGECRTVCRIRLGDYVFTYTRKAPTCLWRIARESLAWRSVFDA